MSQGDDRADSSPQGQKRQSAVGTRRRRDPLRCHPSRMPLRTLHAGEGCQRVLACERSHERFSCESGGGHACRERLPQAGLRGSHRRWAARHSLSGRTQGATARHATTPTPALLLHRAAGAPLEQIHSGSDYRSRVTPQYLPIRASTPGKSLYRNLTFSRTSACTKQQPL